MSTTTTQIRTSEAKAEAARSLNAAYALNRKARTTGDPTAIWEAQTATTCARIAIEKFARLAGLTYEAAMDAAMVARPRHGVIAVPVTR